jgi:hypothetical protein
VLRTEKDASLFVRLRDNILRIESDNGINPLILKTGGKFIRLGFVYVDELI